jgi:3-deoxy-D-manno-octulosonic acid kinase
MPETSAASAARRRYAVPDAVRLDVSPRGVLAWVEGAEAAVRELAADPDGPWRRSGPGPRLEGRGRLARVASPLGPLVVREWRKGGLLRRWRGTRFRGRWRPVDELVVTRRLAGAGVPVADAVGAVVVPGRGPWRGFLLTREVQDAVDLETWLYGRSPVPAGRRDVLPAAGRAVRGLHDAGVAHADLHPKNLLLDPHADRVLVIDLDRARAFDGPVPASARLDNLSRLARSVEKHRLRGMSVGRREALRFLAGYAGSRGEGERWLDRVRASLAPGLRVRRWWWRVTKQLRPAPGASS